MVMHIPQRRAHEMIVFMADYDGSVGGPHLAGKLFNRIEGSARCVGEMRLERMGQRDLQRIDAYRIDAFGFVDDAGLRMPCAPLIALGAVVPKCAPNHEH